MLVGIKTDYNIRCLYIYLYMRTIILFNSYTADIEVMEFKKFMYEYDVIV